MKKTAKRKALSIAAGVLFLIAAVMSGIGITSVSSKLSEMPEEPHIYNEDDFYKYAEPTTYYISNGNGGEQCYGYQIDYFTFCEDYEDYVYITEREHENRYKELESSLVFFIVLTIVFVISGIGTFVVRKKAFSIPFIIAQMVFFTAVTGILINLINDDPDEFHIIVVYALFALLCSLNYIISLSENLKLKSIFAKLSVLHIIINIALYIVPAFLFILILQYDSFITAPLVLSYIPAIIAFLLYCASIRAGYKAVEASERAVQQAVYETPTQAFAYDRQPNLVASSRSANATDEIKKYKELLDMGAITQEEFDAKKKQLLGL